VFEDKQRKKQKRKAKSNDKSLGKTHYVTFKELNVKIETNSEQMENKNF